MCFLLSQLGFGVFFTWNVLTRTLANRMSSSLCSGIGWAARFRTLACRTWWFCCWCFQCPRPLDGEGVNNEITSSNGVEEPPFEVVVSSLVSFDVINPMIVCMCCRYGFCSVYSYAIKTIMPLKANKTKHTHTLSNCLYLIWIKSTQNAVTGCYNFEYHFTYFSHKIGNSLSYRRTHSWNTLEIVIRHFMNQMRDVNTDDLDSLRQYSWTRT